MGTPHPKLCVFSRQGWGGMALLLSIPKRSNGPLVSIRHGCCLLSGKAEAVLLTLSFSSKRGLSLDLLWKPSTKQGVSQMYLAREVTETTNRGGTRPRLGICFVPA